MIGKYISLIKAHIRLNSLLKTRTANIVVYSIVGRSEEGHLLSFPIGVMPRPSIEKEAEITAQANGEMYSNFEIDGDAVIAYVNKGRVDAVSFLSAEIAGKHATQLFDEKTLTMVDKDDVHFRHFPKAKLSAL